MKPSSNAAVDSNDENNFPDNLLLVNTQVSRLCEAFENGSSANIKLPKTHLHKTGLSLMKNVLKVLAKSVLRLLGLTAAASATDAVIHKNLVLQH